MVSELPTFTRCADGRFYEDLVYQDFPERRAWFICFSPDEPAEIVVRESEYRELRPEEILKRRGFDLCLKGIFNARATAHPRFFGFERNVVTGAKSPIDGHSAISWFLLLKKGVPLPAPSQHDSCTEIWPFFPNRPGVYFGDQR